MKAHALALFTILVWSTTFVATLVWSVYSTLVDRIADAGYETLAATKRIFAWGLLFMMPAVPFAGAFPALGLVDPSSLRTCSSWGSAPQLPASPPGTSP